MSCVKNHGQSQLVEETDRETGLEETCYASFPHFTANRPGVHGGGVSPGKDS